MLPMFSSGSHAILDEASVMAFAIDLTASHVSLSIVDISVPKEYPGDL